MGLALSGSDDSGTLSDGAGAAIKSAVTDAHLLLVTSGGGLGTQFGNLADSQGLGRGRHGRLSGVRPDPSSDLVSA
jgi:hypothetical protein